MRRLILTAASFTMLGVGACNRQKIPDAVHVWIGSTGGCAETKESPLVGTLACWGNVFQGPPREYGKRFTLGPGKVAGVSLGARHACATTDGHPFCWGDGAQGQLGPSTQASETPVPVGAPGAQKPESVAAGGAHTCVRGENADTLRCFGLNDAGQLGLTDGKSDWDQGHEIKTVVLGDAQTCASYAPAQGMDPFVLCRGRNMPKTPLLSGHITLQLAVGADHACALLENHRVECWGKNDDGQLGDGTTMSSLVPVPVLGMSPALMVVAGAHHTCALLGNRTVACWGKNDRHQLANGTTRPSNRAEVLVGLVQVKEIAAAGDNACVITDDASVRCWGPNDHHELGDGSTEEHTVPAPVKYR